MSFSLVRTREGACAVLCEDTMEVMHPVVGPRVEAERLYVQPSRLAERLLEPSSSSGDDEPLRLLDVGLGGGSNALAALRVSESRAASSAGRVLEIVSFDRTLDAMRLALTEAAEFGFEGALREAAETIAAGGEFRSERTRWRFVGGELPETLEAAPVAGADIVFWDPFSPRSNPGLWNYGAFSALRSRCRGGCTVHTYSGATSIRSAMLLGGFAVGLGPRISEGKFGTLGAVPPAYLEAPLDARWLERVRRSSAPLPQDAPPDALDRLAVLPQFAGG